MRKSVYIFSVAFLLPAAVLFFSCKQTKETVHSRGLEFNEEKYASVPLKATQLSRNYENLPSSVSLKKYAPAIANQGCYGTCTVWSSVYGARTMLESIELNRTKKSLTTKNAFSPVFVYKHLSSDETFSSGLYIPDVLQFMIDSGAPKMSNFERNSDFAKTPLSIYANARTYTIGDYARLFIYQDSDYQKIVAIKKSISEKKPVIVGMQVFDSFDTSGKIWRA